MEPAIMALIVISVLMLSVLALSERSLSAQATISEAAGAMQERLGERARADLAPMSAATVPSGDYVSVSLRDAGSARLAGFNQWNVILQYTDGAGGYHVTWYPYSSKWTKTIYVDASAGIVEAVELDILNPGEKIVVLVGVSPYMVGAGTTNLATIGAPNSICASSAFTH
jgi:hypothetical protein